MNTWQWVTLGAVAVVWLWYLAGLYLPSVTAFFSGWTTKKQVSAEDALHATQLLLKYYTQRKCEDGLYSIRESSRYLLDHLEEDS